MNMESPTKVFSDNPTSLTAWINCMGTILVSCPIFLYYYSLHVYTVNVPFSDDFSTLNEVMQILNSETLRGKISLLFTHQNEHLHVFTRSIFILVYYVLDEINFKVLVLIANIALLGLLFFACKTLSKNHEKIFLLFPVALLLFQLRQNWVHLIWAMESLASLYALCFSGLTFYFLSKHSNKYFFWALFLAVASAFTHGSGLATLVTGWIILLVNKKLKLAHFWLVSLLFVLLVYLNSLYFVSKSSFFVSKSSLGLSSTDDLFLLGTFFISFLGATASYDNQMALLTLGSLIICYFLFLIYKKYYVTNPAVFGFMLFLFFVAAMVSISRSGGENLVFSNRYKIFSLTMVILVYISVVDLFYARIKRKLVFLVGVSLITSAMFLVSYDEGREKLKFARYSQLYRINQWLDKNYSLYDEGERRTNRVMTKALTNGFYKIPYKFTPIPEKKFSLSVNSGELCNRMSKKPLDNAINVIVVGPEISPFLLRIEGMIYDYELGASLESDDSGKIHVVLGSRQGDYIFTTHSHKRYRTSIHFRPERSNRGLISLIPIKRLNNNIYRIGLCYEEGVVYSDQLLIKQDDLVKILR